MSDYKYYLDNGIYDIQNGNFQQAIDNINKSLELKNDWSIPYFTEQQHIRHWKNMTRQCWIIQKHFSLIAK